MSQEITSRSVRSVRVQAPERMVSFAEIAQSVHTVMGNLTRPSVVAAAATVGGTNVQDRLESVSLREVEAATRGQNSAAEALAKLGQFSGLQIPETEAPLYKERMEAAIKSNDLRSAEELAKDVVLDQQARLRETLTVAARDSLAAMGFIPQKLSSAEGFVIGSPKMGRQTLSVEVRDNEDGGVRVILDANHFHGNSCEGALNELEQELRKRGVDFEVETRKPKRDGRQATGQLSGSAVPQETQDNKG